MDWAIFLGVIGGMALAGAFAFMIGVVGLILFHTRIKENGEKMEQPWDDNNDDDNDE